MVLTGGIGMATVSPAGGGADYVGYYKSQGDAAQASGQSLQANLDYAMATKLSANPLNPIIGSAGQYLPSVANYVAGLNTGGSTSTVGAPLQGSVQQAIPQMLAATPTVVNIPPPAAPAANNYSQNLTSNQANNVNYSPQTLTAILAAANSGNIPAIQRTPMANLLASAPQQAPADTPWAVPQTRSDSMPSWEPMAQTPRMDPAGFPKAPAIAPDRVPPRQAPQIASDYRQQNVDDVRRPYPPQIGPSGWQEEGQPVQRSLQMIEPMRGPEAQPGPGYPQVPYTPQPDPSFAAPGQMDIDPGAQGLYDTMHTPELEQQRRRQRILQSFALRRAMEQPPQEQQHYYAPGQQHGSGWKAFGSAMAQRMAGLNPNVNAQNWAAWKQSEIGAQEAYKQAHEDHRNYMTAATSLTDTGLSQEGANAREFHTTMRELVKEAYKSPTGQATQNEILQAGSKLAEAFAPGPERDQAIAAAAQAGIDLSPWRNVPQSEKAVSLQQSRDWRNQLSEQMFGHRADMNPLQRQIADYREQRLEQTMPDYIRLAKANADLKTTNAALASTYGDEKARLGLEQKRAQIQNYAFSQTNSTLAKVNTINSQYENAYKNYLNAPSAMRPQIMAGIQARFGHIDPSTGVPADVMNARQVSQQLQTELGGMRQQPVQQPSQPVPAAAPQTPQPTPMQAQQGRVNGNPVSSIPIPPSAIAFYRSNPTPQMAAAFKAKYGVDPR